MEPDCQRPVVIRTASEQATRAVAACLAAHFAGGEVVALCGDLGAGKTVFVQGLARGLEVRELPTSPSFVIIHHYPGRLMLYHVDLYRLEPEQVQGLGIEEIMTPDSVVAIEWAERLPQHLSQRLSLCVTIQFGVDAQERRLSLRALDALGADCLRRSAAALGLDQPSVAAPEPT